MHMMASMSVVEMPLTNLQPGEAGRIVRYADATPLCLRLQEMGLLPGTVVRLLRQAPLGDPLQLEVRGYSMSLRRAGAGVIIVRPLE